MTSLTHTTPTISIVIPAINEAPNLRVVLPTLPDVHQIVLVDGGSVDDSVDVAVRARPGIEIVQQTRRGKGNALMCGFAAATGDIVVMFDADGSADPAEIPAFVEALVSGADFAKGSRFRPGGGSHDITRLRSTGNRGLNILANLLLRAHYTDLCYGYNAFWRHTLERLALPDHTGAAPDGAMLWGDGFEIETVLNCRVIAARLQVTEVASMERMRISGASNLHAIRDGIRVLRTILAERSGARRGAVTADSASRPPVQAAPQAAIEATHLEAVRDSGTRDVDQALLDILAPEDDDEDLREIA